MVDEMKHKFEIAGLGRAPFQFINVIERVYVSCPGATPQPSGTCAYCGNGIKYCCVIRDADGKKFEVGNECVKKTDDAGMIKVITDKLRLEQNKKQRERAHQKRIAQIEADRARVERAKATALDPAVTAALKEQPHPFADRAARGETMHGYVSWLFENGQLSGQVRAAIIVERAAEYLQDAANNYRGY